ncbi:MAG: YraN family protein [Schwartzia sp.]|nr:YraN family protein [Schwartzia sp. (in: firmicutes)]
MNTKNLGNSGEEAAARYLAACRYRIRERQYRCPLGEIDLIAERDGWLVFIEVKTRRSLRYGAPALAVTPTKQRRIIRTATWYLQQHPPADRPCRFDVVEVFRTSEGKWHIRQYENAFET